MSDMSQFHNEPMPPFPKQKQNPQALESKLNPRPKFGTKQERISRQLRFNKLWKWYQSVRYHVKPLEAIQQFSF